MLRFGSGALNSGLLLVSGAASLPPAEASSPLGWALELACAGCGRIVVLAGVSNSFLSLGIASVCCLAVRCSALSPTTALWTLSGLVMGLPAVSKRETYLPEHS